MSRPHSWRSALGAAALLATVAMALPASAQITTGPKVTTNLGPIIIYPICPVDLATCQQPGYLETTCGRYNANSCKTLLQNEFQRQYGLLTNTRDSVVPTNLPGGGSASTVRVDARSYAGYYARGLTTAVQGEPLRSQAVLLRNTGSIFDLDPRANFKNDGARVKSCEELVYERYNSFGRFEDVALAKGDDAWGIFFEAYYGDTAIAYQDIRDTLNASVGPLTFPSGPSPKNAFFEPLPREYPPGVTPYPFSSGTLATIEAGRAWHTWGWQRHLDLGWQALGYYNEAQLKEGYELALNHRQAIEHRRRLWDEYQRTAASCQRSSAPATCLSNANTQYGNLLYAQDQLLAFDFYFGTQAGCFQTSGPSVCDWSPQLFWEQVRERVDRVREADFQLCKRLTRNDFRGGVVQQAVTSGIPGGGITAYDWPATPQRFILFLALLDSYLRGLDLPTDPVTGRASLSRFVSDNSDLGNEWFGANFAYEAGWGLVGMEGAGKVCNAQLLAKGIFTANAKVMKSTVSLVDAMAYLDTYTPDMVNDPNRTVLRTHAHLTVLGMSIYDSGWRESPLAFSIAANPSYRPSVTIAVVYVPVLGIPVKVSGGVSGVIGLEASLDGYMQRDCSQNFVGFTAKGALKPYAQVDGFATASVDAVIIEAGIYGRVTLVRIDLPLTMEVGTHLQDVSGQRHILLKANTRLDLLLRTLDGRLGIYGRVLGSSYEKDLVRFTGPEVRSTLFEFTLDPPVSLLALDAVL